MRASRQQAAFAAGGHDGSAGGGGGALTFPQAPSAAGRAAPGVGRWAATTATGWKAGPRARARARGALGLRWARAGQTCGAP